MSDFDASISTGGGQITLRLKTSGDRSEILYMSPEKFKAFLRDGFMVTWSREHYTCTYRDTGVLIVLTHSDRRAVGQSWMVERTSWDKAVQFSGYQPL